MAACQMHVDSPSTTKRRFRPEKQSHGSLFFKRLPNEIKSKAPGKIARIKVVALVVVFGLIRAASLMRHGTPDTHAMLMNLLKSLPHESSRELSNVLPSRLPVKRRDITMVTHASINKLDNLLHQIEQWGGPVSCAVYLQCTTDVEKFQWFLFNNEETITKATFHAILEETGRQYPMNHLRNLAMNNIQSDYFLAMDADFVTDSSAYTALIHALENEPSFVDGLHHKTLYVLPAFERFMPSQLRHGLSWSTTITNSMMPTSRDELLALIKRREAAPFHEYFRQAHGATNFSEWYLDVPDEFSYPIEYQHKFEPYVVGYRYGLPQYWPYFYGFGFNKASWFVELRYLGYHFQVIRDHFVIHKNHPKGGVERQHDREIILEWIRFKRYVIETYNAPKEEFLEKKDAYGDEEWREFIGWNRSLFNYDW